MESLDDHSALVRASGGDPFVRWMIDPAGPVRGWRLPTGVAWVRRTPRGRTSLTVHADVADAVASVPELLQQAPEVQWLTLPRGAAGELFDVVDLDVGDDWEWLRTGEPPPGQVGEDLVVRLDLSDPAGPDAHDVSRLLEAASPRHSAEPDEPGVLWFGARDGSGGLLACAAQQQVGPGVPHLASIATHPEARGSGLGAAVTAATTRAALDAGHPVVTLGMYSDNDVARRLYHRLGFRCDHRWSSRRRRATA